MIIDSLRKYLKQYQYSDEFFERVNIDYLDGDSALYSIEEVPCDPIIKQYIGGDSKRQYQFIFTSTEIDKADVLKSINRSGFYEEFAGWLDKESLKGNLPQLDSDKECIKIEATSTGYMLQTEVDKVKYQIKCRLIYLQKGGN